MVHHPLPVMIFAFRNNFSYVTRLHNVHTIFLHQFVSRIQLFFICSGSGRSFVVHYYIHSFRLPIFHYLIKIIIGIRSYKIENAFTVFESYPMFPSCIPAFHEHRTNTIFCGKINKRFRIYGSSTMHSMGFSIFSISIHILVPGHVPGRFSKMHFPPDPGIFGWLEPGNISKFIRFI